MARKTHKPSAPRDFSITRKEREAERKRLEGQGATVTQDRTGRIVSAYRSNVFNLLLQRRTITASHHDAAARLSASWAEWKGLDGKPEGRSEFVDGGAGCAELVTDRMIRAGREVQVILAQLPILDRMLLERLVSDTVERDRPGVWRVAVQESIGLTTRDRQTEAVVGALESLRRIYEMPRSKAA